VSGHTRLHLSVTPDSAARNILMQQLESNGFTVAVP
jgi:hypothetical protein